MTKPSSRSSVARALFRAAPLALMLLAAFGLFVSGCGDDSPTTPAPTPTPPPAPPAPTPPAVPTGLQVASTGPDFIEWSWTAVEGATGYDIQMSLTAGDFSTNVQLTQVEAGTTRRRFTVAAETTAYARVRAKNADGESDWSAAVSGTSMAAPIVLTQPANLRATEEEPRSITWSWNAVTGASAYEVQFRLNNANFTSQDTIRTEPATTTPQATFAVQPEQVAYVRVRAVAGTGANRVEGPWAVPARGESAQLPLTAPTGLEVSGRGADYLVWAWNAVEGATTYDAQISLDDDDFSPPSDTFLGLTARTQRVSNLSGNRRVYLRVRSARGTQRSDWSDSVDGRTEPPPVVPIATPTGLATSNPQRTSVSLDWNVVDDAEYYEVQQRAAGGSWGAATCRDTDDDEPTDSDCVATGLAAGTEYSFRVRAVPPEDETLQSASEWSASVTARTTGRQSVGGGAGALNISWRSNTTITWRWDQAGDADFETKMLTGVQNRDAPCNTRGGVEGVQLANSLEWPAPDPFRSVTRVLCVRTRTTDNEGEITRGDWSHSWAVTMPDRPDQPDAADLGIENVVTTRHALFEDDYQGVPEVGGVTSSLRWKVSYSNQPEFDYEFRFHVDEAEKTTDDWRAPATGTEQRRCDAMTVSDTVTPGGSDAPKLFESEIDLAPYAEYRMCYRAINDDGRSEWAYNFGDSRYTRPLKPSVGSARITDNVDANGVSNPSGTNFRLLWPITTSTDGPKAGTTDTAIEDDYNFLSLRTIGDSPQTAADPDDVLQACEGHQSTGGIPSNLERFRVGDLIIKPQSTEGTRFDVWLPVPDDSQQRYYYLCVQADDGGDRGLVRGAGESTWGFSSGSAHRVPN